MSQQYPDLMRKGFQFAIVTLITILLGVLPSLADERTLTPSADTMVSSQYPSQNYGNAPDLNVGDLGGNGWMSLVKFDIPGDLSGATINWVELRLMVYNLNQGQSFTPAINQITTSWVETGVTYNTRPTYDTRTVNNDPITSPGEYVVYSENFGNNDLARIVQEWIDNPSSNHGLLLQEGTTGFAAIRSRNYSNSSEWPKLVINYTDGTEIVSVNATPTTPASGTVIVMELRQKLRRANVMIMYILLPSILILVSLNRHQEPRIMIL